MQPLGEEPRLERAEVGGEARRVGGELGRGERLEVLWRRRRRRGRRAAAGGEGDGAVFVEARGGDEVGDGPARGLLCRGVAGAVRSLALSGSSPGDLPPLSQGITQGGELLVEARATWSIHLRFWKGEEEKIKSDFF